MTSHAPSRKCITVVVTGLVVLAGACGGSSKPSSSRTTTTKVAPSTTSTAAIDIETTCRRARQAYVDADDALQKIESNLIDEFNHGVEILQAAAAKDAVKVAKARAELKQHTDKEAALQANLSDAHTVRDQLVTECRNALAGKKLSAPCEAVFTNVDAETALYNERIAVIKAGLKAQQEATQDVESNNMLAADSKAKEASQQADALNAMNDRTKTAFDNVESALKACDASAATSTTTIASTGTPSAELQKLAASFGCTGLAKIATKPGAIETGTCSYKGEPMVVSRFTTGAASHALDYCTANSMASTATDDTWLVASQSPNGALLIPEIATKLGGSVTLLMC